MRSQATGIKSIQDWASRGFYCDRSFLWPVWLRQGGTGSLPPRAHELIPRHV